MIKTATALAAGAVTLFALAGATTTAHAAGDVSVSYGCNSATFTNRSQRQGTVSYGPAMQGEAEDAGASGRINIEPGQTKTVKVSGPRTSNWGWRATLGGEGESPTFTDGQAYGVDLASRCTSSTPSKSSTAGKSSSDQKAPTGGLAKTGWWPHLRGGVTAR